MTEMREEETASKLADNNIHRSPEVKSRSKKQHESILSENAYRSNQVYNTPHQIKSKSMLPKSVRQF